MSKEQKVIDLKRLGFWALVLNAVWEFVQCAFLFDMWSWEFWRASGWMGAAILRDVLIVFGVVYLSRALVGEHHLIPPDLRGWLALLGTGFVAAVFLEWLARALQLWDYGALMPVIELGSFTVGISPVIQITLLPAIAAWLHGVHWR